MMRYRTAEAAGSADTLTEEAIQELRGNLTNCVALGDERVSLALQTYELVRIQLISILMLHHLRATVVSVGHKSPKARRIFTWRLLRLNVYFEVLTICMHCSLQGRQTYQTFRSGLEEV
jgi:hypothetical protein